MNLFDFLERFPEEEDCLEYFISMREKAGIQCQSCGHNEHIRISTLNEFECTKCKNHISIKSGTAMEDSKLPIKYWFAAIQLFTDSENLSITEIQQKISGEDQEQVYKMLETLKECLIDPENGKSFDQLLLTCIALYSHPPAARKAG